LNTFPNNYNWKHL